MFLTDIPLPLCRRSQRQEKPQQEIPWYRLNPPPFYLISRLTVTLTVTLGATKGHRRSGMRESKRTTAIYDSPVPRPPPFLNTLTRQATIQFGTRMFAPKPSLMALASTNLLWPSGRASEVVIRRS